MKKGEVRARAEEMWRQHGELNEITGRLLRVVGDEFDWYDLDRDLTDLERVLVRHFELEEQGGYLSDVRRTAPSEIPLIDRLATAHVMLRENLRRMRHLAIDKSDRPAMRDLLVDWLDVLARHEAAENRLVQLVLDTDLGNAD